MEGHVRTRYLKVLAAVTLAVAFLPGIAPTAAQVPDPPRLHIGMPDYPTGFVGVNFNPDPTIDIAVLDENLDPAQGHDPWTVPVDGATENGRVDFDFSEFSEPLKPGWTVQVDSASHGLLSMVITDLVVTGWDVGTGLVYGTTNYPGEINFSIWAPDDANRHAVLTPSPEGFDWEANFETEPSAEPGTNEFGGPFVWEEGNTCGQAEQSNGDGLTVYLFGDACGPPPAQPLIGGNLMSDILFVDDFTPNGQVQVTLTRGHDGTGETIFDDVLETDDSGSVGGPNLFSLRLPVDPGMRLVATDVTDSENPGPTKELDLVVARVDAYDPVGRVLQGYTPNIPVGGYLMILGLYQGGAPGPVIEIDPADHPCDPAGLAGTWCYQIPPQYEVGAYIDWEAGGLGIDVGDADYDSTYTNLATFRASGQEGISGAASSQHDDTTSVDIIVRDTSGAVVLGDPSGTAPYTRPVSELGEFEADFLAEGVQLEPGFEVTVTATDTGFSKALILDPLRIDGIDFEGDTLFGVASPGAYLEIEAGGRLLNLQAGDDASDGNPGDGLGAWLADFSVFHPEGFDLVDGMFVRAAAIDPDLDVTWYEFFSEEPPPGPAFNVDPLQNLVEGYGWEEGTEVTITLDDGDPATEMFTSTALVERWSEEPGDVGFWTELEFDVEDGHLVTVTDGITTKDHIVTSLTVDGIHEENDLVFGTAEPGSDVQVGLWGTETEPHVERALVANDDPDDEIPDGYWEADFSVAVGPEEWQQAREVTAETFGAAWQGDEDGDATHVGFGEQPPPEPSIEVDPFFDKVFLNGMSELAALMVNDVPVEDEAGLPLVPTERDGQLVFYLYDVVDIVTGDFVVVTDGDIVREHTVKPLGVTAIDAVAETITGYTEGNAELFVGAGNGFGEAERFITSNTEGVWTADMANPPEEGFDIDKTVGWSLYIAVPDDDGDATVYTSPIASPGMTALVQYDMVTAEGSGLSDITISIPALGYETTAPFEPQGPAMIGDIRFEAGVIDPEFFVGRAVTLEPDALVPGLEIYSSDIMYEMQLTVLDFSVDEANTVDEELRGYIEPGDTHVAIAFALRDRIIDEPEDLVGIGFTEADEEWSLPLCRPEALEDDIDPQVPGEQPGCTPDGLHDLGNGEVGWAFGLEEPDPEFDTYTVLLWDLAPTITELVLPSEPVQLEAGGVDVALHAAFTDIEYPDEHIASIDWGDGTATLGTVTHAPQPGTSGTVDATHTYEAPGVYLVALTVTDEFGEFDTAEFRYVVVYDPGAGFTTGGGWIEPEADVDLAGETVNFGFNVKYRPNSTLPQGVLNVQLGDLHLHSTTMEWLVITAEDWAHFAGGATIAGSTDLYPFRVDLRDGDIYGMQPDWFELRVWEPGADPLENDPLYTVFGDLAGGNVKIHD